MHRLPRRLGHLLHGTFERSGAMEVAHLNLPVAVLVWLMILPMLLKIDFQALRDVRQHWRGVAVTLSVVLYIILPVSAAILWHSLLWRGKHGQARLDALPNTSTRFPCWRYWSRWFCCSAFRDSRSVTSRSRYECPAAQSEQTRVDPHVNGNARDVTGGDRRRPFKMAKEGVATAGLTHESDARG